MGFGFTVYALDCICILDFLLLNISTLLIISTYSEMEVVSAPRQLGGRGTSTVQKVSSSCWCCAGSADHTVQLWGTKSVESSETSAPDSAGPLSLLQTFQTKATPVFYVHFTPMNLLIGSGALTLRR